MILKIGYNINGQKFSDNKYGQNLQSKPTVAPPRNSNLVCQIMINYQILIPLALLSLSQPKKVKNLSANLKLTA